MTMILPRVNIMLMMLVERRRKITIARKTKRNEVERAKQGLQTLLSFETLNPKRDVVWVGRGWDSRGNASERKQPNLSEGGCVNERLR